MLFAVVASYMGLQAADRFVKFESQPEAIALKGATIGYSDQDYEAVKIAIRSLQDDFERVLGSKPQVTTDKPTIVIGTIGKNKAIDALKLKDLKGKREKFIITTVGGQLFIAGSDRRGTVYGIYELSQQLGVSPWYWWADAPVTKRDNAYVLPGSYTDGEPAVDFRGLFLNDEAPCLTSWVKNTFGC